MRKIAAAVIFFLLAGSAAAFSASLEVADRTASLEEPGEFLVEVKNTDTESKIFRVSVSPYSSWFYTEGSKMVPAGETHTFRLVITPPEDAVQQNYRFDATVTTGDRSESFTDYFTVRRSNDLVVTGFSSDKESYSPGEAASFQIDILNTAPARIENYRLRAALQDKVVDKQGLPLSPGSTGRLNLNMNIPENAPPGENQVRLSITRNGETRYTVNQSIDIRKVERIERSSDVDNRILFYTRTKTVENTGNARAEATVNQTLPDYLRPVTTFSQEPDRVDAGESTSTYTWVYELEPGESERVSYTSEYWIPGSILAAFLIGLVVLKKLRTGVKFDKRARKTEDGVKVHLELENHSNETVREVTVKDFVPDIATVLEDFPMAKPVIRKTSNGTRLSWEIEELEPGSQRVFEYTIKPRFKVEGGAELPAAELEAGDRRVLKTGTAEAEFQPGDT